MSNIVIKQAKALAENLGIQADGEELIETLKATAFKGQVTDAQMAALLIVAKQYNLSPWTKEIYAFPDKNNGIVPVVGVDGWSRIINEHPQFDGIEFEQNDEGCTCIIYRKDRNHPTKVTEYMAECKRGTQPWSSHPKRMLRHKALIQCARVAFGFGGIYDQDEAERIVERDMGVAEVVSKPTARAELSAYPEDDFDRNLPAWRNAIMAGKKTAAEVVAMVSTKGTLSPEQRATIMAITQPVAAEVVDSDFVRDMDAAQEA